MIIEEFKYILLGLLLSIAQDVVFTPEVAKITTLMSENVYEERGLCLKYKKVGSVLIIYDYTIPKTFSTEINSIVSYPCPADYPITWHTHNGLSIILSESLRKYYFNQTGVVLERSEQMLYLSSRDINYALQYKPEYMMVQVSGSDYAWWHISQIERGKMLLPIDGQSTHQ